MGHTALEQENFFFLFAYFYSEHPRCGSPKSTFILVTGQAAAKLHFILRPCQVLTGQPITHLSAERIIVFMIGVFACVFVVRSGVVKR